MNAAELLERRVNTHIPGVVQSRTDPNEFMTQFRYVPEKLACDERLDVVVIGAGIVGLAVAREFALQGREVIVIEREPAIGQHTSGRFSEVNHSGINNRPGSLKARMCVAGHDLLEVYCQERGVPYNPIGKLIVATNNAEEAKLRALLAQGRANGVRSLEWKTAEEAQLMEPALKCTAALFSPSTGIFNSHRLLQAFQRDIERHGGHIFLSTQVHAGYTQEDGVILTISRGPERLLVHATTTINCAGLNAPFVSTRIFGKKLAGVPDSYRAAGHYFRLRGPSPFNHLIYPVRADPGSLGVHATYAIDDDGKVRDVRFGPDIAWLKYPESHLLTPSYDFVGDVEKRMRDFEAAIRQYWPGLPDDSLVPDFVGIRPKAGPDKDDDFIFLGPQNHGAPGWVDALAIESPGATSCLAMAEYIVIRAAEPAIPLTQADVWSLIDPVGTLQASFNNRPEIDFFA